MSGGNHRTGRCCKCRRIKKIRGFKLCFTCFAEDYPEKKGGSEKGNRENQETMEEINRRCTENAATMPDNLLPGKPMFMPRVRIIKMRRGSGR